MPLLKSLFEKDISRYIETVIKADEREHLADEMNEYVLTDEVAGKIGDFFEHYSDTNAGRYQAEGPNGVWISGFFGSGKSHLLKIISYALENQDVNGVKTGTIFIEKVKQQKDPKLKADVEKSLRIPSESILFNIDQKADALNATDSLLAVFYKVFNEHCGYSTTHFLAGIERHLCKKGTYEQFKKVFKKKFKASWEQQRTYLHLIASDFAEAYAEVSGMSLERALELFDNYDEKFSLSIEDFANDVNEYIEAQPAGFRLNFFVDEVGQYIGNNSKLMLNLQTIVETLATKTKRRAWVFVTSQSDLTTAIGDVTRQQQQDYSKINARFAVKLPLTGKNAEEVIRKRLLQKNTAGSTFYSQLYKQWQNNLGTIFHFREGMKYKQFADEAHFVHLSPFIPYQADLFQQCIKGLSEHNMFQGRFQSFGERSMLGVFQIAAKDIANKKAGQWITYDRFYDGIEGTLRPELIILITQSQRHLDSDMAIRLLKILFLVKYTTTFKATAQNCAILMISDLDCDLEAHEKSVREALNLLETNAYIKRSADGYYEFLTSEEKDIQTEINQVDIHTPEITGWIADIVFKEIVGTKITCQATGQSYDYCRRIDDIPESKNTTLGINLISRFHDLYDDRKRLCARSTGSHDLLVRLGDNSVNITSEVAVFLKTALYNKQQHNPSESRRLIIEGLRIQNNERERSLRRKVEELLATATIYHNGTEVPLSANNGKVRIYEAFQQLIAAVYTELNMLPVSTYTDDMVKKMLVVPANEDAQNTALNTAEEEVLLKIKRKESEGVKISVEETIKEFQLPPYGWHIAATLYQIASLAKKERIEISQNESTLAPRKLAEVIANSKGQATLMIRLKETYTESDVKTLSGFYLELFDENISVRSPSECAETFRNRLQKEVEELQEIWSEFSQLPSAEPLDATIICFKQYLEKDATFYLREIVKKEDELLDVREKSKRISAMLRNKSQKEILRQALRIIDKNENLNYEFIPVDKREALQERCMAKRIESVPEIKALCDDIAAIVQAKLDTVRDEIVRLVQDVEYFFSKKDPVFASLSTGEREQVLAPLAAVMQEVHAISIIPTLLYKRDSVKDLYGSISAAITTIADRKGTPPEKSRSKKGATTPPLVEKPIIASSTIKVDKKVPVVETEEELNTYLEAVHTAWGNVIKEGKRISI